MQLRSEYGDCFYFGVWGSGPPCTASASSIGIDWSSYTPPKPAEAPACAQRGHAFATNQGECCIYCCRPRAECAEAPKLCECCGVRPSLPSGVLAGDTSTSEGLAGARYAHECMREFLLQGICDRIRARRQPTATPGSGEQDSSGSAGSGAGNHPATAPCEGSGVFGPAQPDETIKPTCSECGALAALVSGMCVYCAHSHGISINGNHWREVAHPDRETADSEILDDMATRMSERKPRARNEAALLREVERPRGNRRDEREFAKPHPWEEF